ncbi:MAG: hypothetical protein AB8C13_07220 [Phycisphaerales bacterium]
MKLKGVNPIVQHIEKIVLGITVLIFLAVISMQFVTQPNLVQAGSREVAPDQIYNELASTATALQSQITDTSPALPDVSAINMTKVMDDALEQSSGSASLPIALGKSTDVTELLNITGWSGPTQTAVNTIEAMTVPKTTKPLASSNWGTLDPYAVVEVPAYADFVPVAQPYDFASVSIEADFPGTSLRDVLQGNDGYPGVPNLFWVSTGMAVMGLEAHRQELMADGSWSEPTPITTPPGTPLPTSAVSKDDGLVRLNEIIASAQEVSPQVIRPMFPPTISGPLWEAPSDSVDADKLGLSETQRLERRLTQYTAEVERLRNPQRPRPANDPRTGGGKSTRDPGRNQPSNRPGGNDANTDRIERLDDLINDIKEDLERLGVTVEENEPGTGELINQELVQMWVHDMGVKPGATYRYRTRAVLNNPYFRKGPYLDETDSEQQALTVDPFARGDWSEWSDPVTVGAKEFFFVTEATQPVSGSALPSAKVELYSMYYGYYRRSSITLEPGQPLLASLRLSDELMLVDTQTIQAEDAAKFIQDLNAGNVDTNTASEIPEGLTKGPDRFGINMGAYLVQILNDPVAAIYSDQQSYQLIFRLSDGSLEFRNSVSDDLSTIYEQAQASAVQASRAKLRETGAPAMSGAAALFQPVEP